MRESHTILVETFIYVLLTVLVVTGIPPISDENCELDVPWPNKSNKISVIYISDSDSQ